MFAHPLGCTVFQSLDPNSPVPAVLVASAEWSSTFQNILPGDDQIIAVLENTCNQTLTFALSGIETHFIGTGDHHDTRYESIEMTQDIVSLAGCHYTIRVNPSREFEDSYKSNEAIWRAIGIVATVIFTSIALVGCLYANSGFSVAPRRADSSNKVQDTPKVSSKPEPWKTLSPWDGKDNSMSESHALLCTDCCIIFIQLHGFEKWSAKQPAYKIIDLLGYVYREFDRIAEKLSVSKVS